MDQSWTTIAKKKRDLVSGATKEMLENSAEALAGTLATLQRTMRNYETSKHKEEIENCAVKIQRVIRRVISTKDLQERCLDFKKNRRMQARNAMRGFTFTEAKYRCDAYQLLIRMIGADLSFQDILCEVISEELFKSIQRDLFSGSPTLRNLATHFILECCHRHKGNQRLLCKTNGITIANVRILGVSTAFEKKYHEWCTQHGAKITYEGTVSYLEGLVSTSIEFYRNTEPLEKRKRHLRDSVYSYPWAGMYSELDPQSYLIGVILEPVLPRPIIGTDRVAVKELFNLFQDAARAHGDPVDLLDSLVPSVPLYAFLIVVRERVAMKNLSRTLELFLGSEQNISELVKVGKVEDWHSECNTDDFSGISISDAALIQAAQEGGCIFWAPVASKYTRFVLSTRIKSEYGNDLLQDLNKLIKNENIVAYRPPGSHLGRVENTGALQEAKYVPRYQLVKALKASESFQGLVDSNPRFIWEILGPLQKESFSHCTELSKFSPSNGATHFGIRNRIQGIDIDQDSCTGPIDRLGGGECPWDWISWDELLSIISDTILNSEQGTGHLNTATTMKGMCPCKELSTGLWAPTKIGHTARRAKILQKQLRDFEEHRSATMSTREELRKHYLEQELLILSKILGKVNPILSPAHLGFSSRALQDQREEIKSIRRASSIETLDEEEMNKIFNRSSNTETSTKVCEVKHLPKEESEKIQQLDSSSVSPLQNNLSGPATRPTTIRSATHSHIVFGLAKQRKVEKEEFVFDQTKLELYHKEKQKLAESQARRREDVLRRKREEIDLMKSIQAKMHLRWAQEGVKRDKAKIVHDQYVSKLNHARFILQQEHLQAKADQEKIEQILADPPSDTRQLENNCEATPKNDFRERVTEFDALVRLRNQLIFNPPQGSEFEEGHFANDKVLPENAKLAAPIWTLCKETKRRKEHRKKEMLARSFAPDSLDAQLEKARMREVRYTSVGGYLLKTDDVKEILSKQYTVEEIKESCKKFGNVNMPARTAFIVAQHLHTKKMVEKSLGIDLEKLDDGMVDILADLQSNDIQRPVASAIVAAKEDEEYIRGDASSSLRKSSIRSGTPTAPSVSPRRPQSASPRMSKFRPGSAMSSA